MTRQSLSDWSEPLSTLPARVVQLTEALNQHKYYVAMKLASRIGIDMIEVMMWIAQETLKGENA